MNFRSIKAPITLPAVVAHYFEPNVLNDLRLVGGNRASHQIFVAHQIRLLNTLISYINGDSEKNTYEIAAQNRDLEEGHLQHLLNIVAKLLNANLITVEKKLLIEAELSAVFNRLFPNSNLKNL